MQKHVEVLAEDLHSIKRAHPYDEAKKLDCTAGQPIEAHRGIGDLLPAFQRIGRVDAIFVRFGI